MEKEMKFVEQNSDRYPVRLREIPSSPKQLYCLGELPSDTKPSVAIIGARECSEYGKVMAREIGSLLGKNGIQVISGMARGIDGISQEAALEAGGKSFAVLGSGVDICYPKGNHALYQLLQKRGGVLSEFPPGTPPRAQNFPARNRIVSGLADVIVVVEARLRSGTLITVDMALEQGREVYAIPGRVTDRLSDGCNRLIKFGANPLLDGMEFVEDVYQIYERKKNADDILYGGTDKRKMQEKLHIDKKEVKTDQESEKMPESQELREILGVLDYYPKNLSQITCELKNKYEEKQMIHYLMQLCIEKYAVQLSPGQFCIQKN